MKLWKPVLILPATLVAFVFGFVISLQIETQKNLSLAGQITAQRMEQTKLALANAQAINAGLKEEQRVLLSQLEEAKKQIGTDPQLLVELIQLRILDGTQAVEGPGIQISIDDRSKNVARPLNTEDLTKIVNTLKFASAEAISVNDRRIVSKTAIVMSGSSTILVNEKPITRTEGVPFEINAIGDQETLYEFFTKLEAQNLKLLGISVNVTRKIVRIPSYKGTYSFDYARPVGYPSFRNFLSSAGNQLGN